MDSKEFFNSLAYDWDNKYGYHDVNKIRKIIELSKIKKGSSILDVATGTGVLVSFLLETSPEKITAVDISDKMIEVARSKYNDKRVEFVVKDAMEFCGDPYDYIFVYSAYPHFNDKKGLIKHLCSIMKPDGKLVIAHSENREKINAVHKCSRVVCRDILPAAKETAGLMSEFFDVENVIDNEELYYVSGIKK